MKDPVLAHPTDRRQMLKLSGMGVLGGVATGALTAGKAQADAAIKIPHAMWIEAYTLQVEYPDRIASERRTGFSINIEGKPSTTNWFHIAIPTPLIVDDVRLVIDSVMLRFKTYSVDAWVRDIHVYDGDIMIAAHNGVNLKNDHLFERFVVPDTPPVFNGIGISIGVSFGVEPMSHHMEFFSAGADFVLPK